VATKVALGPREGSEAMKDKLLLGTIVALVVIVVMQWTMPSGQASISTGPVGGVVSSDQGSVLMADGSIWVIGGVSGHDDWIQTGTLPMPPSQVLYWDAGGGNVVDKNGDFWSDRGQGWHDYGKPPIGPVANEQSTWGKVKAKFNGK
jgi:hypothetical protein